MGRSQKKRLDDFMRGQEIKRLKRIEVQEQIARDYIATHSELALKNENYPLTEKCLKGSPEDLKKLLLGGANESQPLEVNPDDFPEGLVLPEIIFDVNVP